MHTLIKVPACAIQTASLVPQCNHRINARGASRWNVTGKQRDRGNQGRNDHIGSQVERVASDHDGRNETADSNPAAQADCNSDGCQNRSLPYDKRKDIAALSAKREPDADFVSPLDDSVTNDAVNTDSCQE